MANQPWLGSQRRDGSFESFLDGWLVRQEHYLDELLFAKQNSHESRDDDLKELISRILAHYQEYYEEKSRIAQRDIFLVFSPTWFSTLEKALLWIAGFKPGLVLQVVRASVDDLSGDQSGMMNGLIDETRAEERALNDELAKIQESVAAPPILEAARRHGRSARNNKRDEDSAITQLKSALEAILASADCLRTNTALKIVEILRPAQAVKFLVAVTQLQLRIRTRGFQKDAERKEPMDDLIFC